MTTTPTPDLDPDAVRLVEDTIDATSVYVQTGNRADRVAIPTADTGPAIVRALLEAGWQPPTPTTRPALGTEFVIEERHERRWVRARTLGPIVGSDEQDLVRARALLGWYRTLHPHTTFRLIRENLTRTRTVIDRTVVDPPTTP